MVNLTEKTVLLDAHATDDDVLAVVRDWSNTLADENYQRAYDMVAHDPYYRWSPQLIRQVIEGYGLPEAHPNGPFKVSQFAATRAGGPPRHKVDRFENTAQSDPIGEVWFDLPLNGEWSDLTATFGIYHDNDHLVLCLLEIHVF